MKKFLSLLLVALPLSFFFTSCSDDDDLPDVSMNISYENARMSGDTLYVVQGDTLGITSINIKNNEPGKKAIVQSANYHFLGRSYVTIIPPFRFFVATSGDPESYDYIPVGKYPLVIYVDVAAEDKSLATGAMPYIIKIVASAEDIPADAVPGDSGTTGTPTGYTIASK